MATRILTRNLPALACLVALLLPWIAPRAASLPRAFEADYSLSAQGMEVARSRWRLREDGSNRFHYSTRSESIGLAKLLRDQQVEEHSHFELGRAGVRPLSYRYERTGRKPRTASVTFDWSKGTGENAINEDRWSLPLQPGMQDKLSYLFALMHAVAIRGQVPATIMLSDGGKVKEYTFTKVGSDRRESPGGTVETVVIERRAPGEARVTRIWLAPALHHLPVLIEHQEDGERISVVLTALQGLAP